MPASVAVFLLATLPIAQSSYAPTPGEPASPKPNRRILAPEYPAPLSQGAEPPARQHPTRRRTALATSASSTRSMAGPSAILG